ncbi:50S ribosomal protein L11 methyltransferase [Acetanaerobacterium elongatum]|uniref:Ribosomal protein L11 methyltransferase n=1 Tax=Acetanaerobacterium elongatum TaxID=258515 RepID=A0A1G9V474_9FIRM|nr:50S ribosomal protein L11 methyltransferase [Acetanaerobacterium elongatum]SDM66846.1 ribosomal protein L11 methyltransferase [Acetanaerobacterium elongatum]
MDFTQVTIYTTALGVDIVTATLMQLGINGFEIEDAGDFEAFLADTQPHWDYVDESLMRLKDAETNIKIYLPVNEQGAQQLAAVKDTLNTLKDGDTGHTLGRLEAELTNVREEDWANNWKQYFKPFEVGNKFVIKPSWEEYNNQTDRVILEIDPSSSFGTGTHHTTQLCIEQLEQYVKEGSLVLDMGCGSGILSVAALLLGAQRVAAVDIDQNSVKIAQENVAKNGFDMPRFSAVCGNVLEDEALSSLGEQFYDVVVANIVADVIIAMRGLFGRYLKQDGVLICSGIISQRADEVRQTLEQSGFETVSRHEKQDWTALVLQKRQQ